MPTKASRARDLHKQGWTVNEISIELQMEPTNVRKSLQRLSNSERNKQTKGLHTHNFIQPWKRKEAVQGACVAWTVVNGEAVQCGVPCAGQLCDEHAHTTRPLVSPLGRRLQS